MKVGVIIYHSNIQKIYEDRWIKKSIESMINQSFSELTFYEVNYSGLNTSILNEYNINKKFWSVKLENYASAMNFIINEAFKDECDYVFNTNLDDYYHVDRIKLQLDLIDKYDILSTDFVYIQEFKNENGEEDKITRLMGISKFSDKIGSELSKNHNVIAHPSVCYNKTFWESGEKYDISKTPEEDLDLWKRLINKNYRIGILPENLLYYRIHNKQISNRKVENVY